MSDKRFIPLKIHSFLDFCIRCEEIYNCFWELYVPIFDIAIYRDYLLYETTFSENKEKQEMFAGLCWEFLMGDILRSDLYENINHLRGLVDNYEKYHKNNDN